MTPSSSPDPAEPAKTGTGPGPEGPSKAAKPHDRSGGKADAQPDARPGAKARAKPGAKIGPGPVSRPAPAVVASLTRAERRRRTMKRAWGNLIGPLGIAAILHGVALWAVVTYLLPAIGVEDPLQTLMASLDAFEEVDPVEEEVPTPELEEPEEPDIVPPEVEVVLPDEAVDLDDLPIEDSLDILGTGNSIVGGGGGGRGRRGGGLGEGEDLRAFGDADSPFRGFVDDIRGRGLDVVFVIDATGSMQRFIDRARDTIDDIIADLATVVPPLRTGIVAYRDLNDDWVSKRAALSSDRYQIHNFLLDLEAAGGRRDTPDFEEAVEVGLQIAAEEFAWRDGARRVIILVGDAPYHDEDQSAALATVRSFARDRHSLVNTIYVGSGGLEQPTGNQLRAREAWQKIARTGDGLSFDLFVDDAGAGDALRKSVSLATFGDEWADEIQELQANAPTDARLAQVQRRVRSLDRKWLIRRMLSQPLPPSVAEGCLEVFNGQIAAAMYAQLADAQNDPPQRSAALYVLKHAVESIRGIPYDVYAPPQEEQQSRALAAIKHQVRQMKGADKYLDGKVGDQIARPPPLPAQQKSDGRPPPPPPGGGG